MKKCMILLFVVILVMSLACTSQQAVTYLHPAVHLQLARANKGPNTVDCYNWTGLNDQQCSTDAQSVYAGSTDNPATVSIKTWLVGRIQLNNTIISRSWGLTWSDKDGNTVDPKDMQEGIFYTYHKARDPAGFDLVEK